MHTSAHPLVSDTPGTQRQVIAHHFGQAGSYPRIYIQSGLHAGEIPGMLVSRHLLPLLEAAEKEGRITGEIVVVPVANPIGLAQGLLHENIGRFELDSMENFNRHYPDLAALVADDLDGKLGSDASANRSVIRDAMRAALRALQPATELASLRAVLLTLAHDADMVLDLHCDLEALCHLYTTDNSRDWGAELSRHIDGRLVLLSPVSGGHAFDEACSTPWDLLRERYGSSYPIPAGCHAATVELRGLADVNDTLANADAQHVFGWLGAVAAINCAVPPAPSFPTGDLVPLSGTDDMLAPFGGVISFRLELGTRVKPGDVVADMINPLTGERAEIVTRNEGLLYARENRRFVRRSTSVAQVSGAMPLRSGHLLSAR